MNAVNQIRFLLALVAALLFLVLLQLSGTGNHMAIPSFVSELHAQAAQAQPDVLFFPVGNQDVRKFVFWDRRANEIHIYSGGGKFEETWQVGTLGQDLTKQKK